MDEVTVVEKHYSALVSYAKRYIQRLGLLDYDYVSPVVSEAIVLAARSYREDSPMTFRAYANFKIKAAIIDFLRIQLGRHKRKPRYFRESDLRSTDGMKRTNSKGTTFFSDNQRKDKLTDFEFKLEVDRRSLQREPWQIVADMEMRDKVIAVLNNRNTRIPLGDLVSRLYENNEKASDIATEFGVTQGRISQLRSQALSAIKTAGLLW